MKTINLDINKISNLNHNKTNKNSKKNINKNTKKKVSKNIQNDENELCGICLESLNSEQIFEIPECGHKYHSNCIIHWYRIPNNDKKCPYCNCLGPRRPYYRGNMAKQEYLKNIINYSRKKNAPENLKKMVKNLKDIKNSLNLKKKQYNKAYKDANISKLCKERNKLESKRIKLENKISERFNIQPILVVKKKIIYEKKPLPEPINKISNINDNNINLNDNNINLNDNNTNLNSNLLTEELSFLNYSDNDSENSSYNGSDQDDINIILNDPV